MRLLEIDEKEFINLEKVICVKIKEDRAVEIKEKAGGTDISDESYRLEFELDNNSFKTSKKFETVDKARMWIFEQAV